MGETISYAPLRKLGGALPASAAKFASEMPSVARADDSTSTSIFINESDLTILSGRRIERVNPLVADNTAVRIILRRNSQPVAIEKRPGTNDKLVVVNHMVDFSLVADLRGVRGVFLRQAYRNGEATESRNNWFRSGARLKDHSITGLDARLTDGTEVVVAAYDSSGRDWLIENSPGTSAPLEVLGSAINLDLDVSKAILVDVLTPDGGGPTSLMLRKASQYTFDPRSSVATFSNLNPLINDQTALRVEWLHAGGVSHTEVSAFGEYEFEDATVRGGRQYRYEINAMRRAPVSSARSVEVASSAAVIGPVSASDSEPPEIMSIEAVWLPRSEAIARVAAEIALMRIRCTSGARCVAMLTRVRQGGSKEMIGGWRAPATFDALTDTFQYELRDTPDGPSLPKYAVRLRSVNGREADSNLIEPGFSR